MTLEKYLTCPRTGKRKRGALSRVAEVCGVSPGTVLRVLRGERTPSPLLAMNLQNCIHSRLEIVAKKPGKQAFSKKLTSHFSEVKASRKSHKGNFAAK